MCVCVSEPIPFDRILSTSSDTAAVVVVVFGFETSRNRLNHTLIIIMLAVAHNGPTMLKCRARVHQISI